MHVLRRQGWLIGLVTALALGAAGAVTALQKPVYRASMNVVVGQGGGIFQPQFGGSVQPFVRTMANLFASDVVARSTIHDLRLHTTPTKLLDATHVSTRPDSSVLEVSYDSPRRAQALRVLADMGSVFTTLIKQKVGAPVAAGTEITASVFDPAHLEPGRVSPRPARNLGFAAALGLALGLVLAFVRDGLDSRIRSLRDAERWFGAPVLGALPRGRRGRSQVGVDAIGMVRASLQLLGGGTGGPVITITSAVPQEGKTTLCADLSRALTATGNRVICVEADLRRPKLREYLELPTLSVAPNNHGLSDVLAGGIELERALVELLPPGLLGGRLQILPAGLTRSNPGDLLTAQRVEQLVKDLQGRADYVIFDTPPLLDTGDAFPFARVSDSVIVVARAGMATKETASAVRVTLERLEVGRAGVVLVDWQTPRGYGYGYGSDSSGLARTFADAPGGGRLGDG
jgi:Mrp family chromosome partitioning ATPase/capsular polysaccharide biosynthesis protein